MKKITQSFTNVCICGGGNLGQVCAGIIASGNFPTSILTGHPHQWSNQLSVFDPNGRTFKGNLKNISDRPDELISEADIILICLPGYLIEQKLREIAPFLKSSALVGSVVSSTGFFKFAHTVIPNQPIFGFQRVPFISRIKEYGHSANLLGYRQSLKVAIEHVSDSIKVAKLLEQMFMTPVEILNSFYEAALTNSNPLLHTARLYSLWGTSAKRQPVSTPVLFYREWTDEASELLIDMDSEFMTLVKTLGVSENAVIPILKYYESTNAPSLTRKIAGIPAFASIVAPMQQTPQGWIPDFTSRYFTEDFNFGLRFIKELAEEHHISTPTIDRVFAWGLDIMNSQ